MQVNPTPSTNIPACMGIALSSDIKLSSYLTDWQLQQNIEVLVCIMQKYTKSILLFSPSPSCNTVRAWEITSIWIYHIKDFYYWSCLPIISLWYFKLQSLFFIQELQCALVFLLNYILLCWIVSYLVWCTSYRWARRKKTEIKQIHPKHNQDTGIFLNKSD